MCYGFVYCTLSFSTGPEFSREAWLSVKNTLGLDFPNVSTLAYSPGLEAGLVWERGAGTPRVEMFLLSFTAAIFDRWGHQDNSEQCSK